MPNVTIPSGDAKEVGRRLLGQWDNGRPVERLRNHERHCHQRAYHSRTTRRVPGVWGSLRLFHWVKMSGVQTVRCTCAYWEV